MGKITEDERVIEFLERYTENNTVRLYTQAIKDYSDFTGLTPSELINESEEDIINGTLPRRRKIKAFLSGFQRHLHDKDLADNTIKSKLAGVKAFYNFFDIQIPSMQGDRKRIAPLEGNIGIPTKEDLQKVLKVCEPLERALVLLGCSSGIASNELKDLKVSDFKKGYDSKTGVTMLQLRRKKANVDYTTFTSPEASKAILSYLEFRSREEKACSEMRKRQLEKQRVTSDSNYLFILRNVPSEYMANFDDSLRQLTDNAITKIYRSISDKAQMNTKEGDWNLIRSHTMRRWFNSAMLNAGCGSVHVETFMGHTLPKTQAAYFRATPEKLKEIYLQFVPYLTIVGEAVNIVDSTEWRDLKNENTKLKSQVEKYFLDGFELIRAKAEVRKLQIQLMPEEERNKARTDDIIKFVVDMKPENESQVRFKEEMKKIFKL